MDAGRHKLSFSHMSQSAFEGGLGLIRPPSFYASNGPTKTFHADQTELHENHDVFRVKGLFPTVCAKGRLCRIGGAVCLRRLTVAPSGLRDAVPPRGWPVHPRLHGPPTRVFVLSV